MEQWGVNQDGTIWAVPDKLPENVQPLGVDSDGNIYYDIKKIKAALVKTADLDLRITYSKKA